MAAHEPDIVFMPIADFHRVWAAGDRYYRGFAIVTSKFTGGTALPSVLVVRKDDPATGIADLVGASFGYINRSCTSSYFAFAILLQRMGRSLDDVGTLRPTPPWQGQIDATVAVIVVRDGLDENLLHTLLDALVGWQPKPEDIFGGFKPFADSDVAGFFADLDQLPATL